MKEGSVMMAKCLLLLKISMLGQLKSKGKGWSMATMGILGVVLIFYSYLMAVGLGMAGMAQVIPSYAIVLTSLGTLFFTALKTNGILFAYRDYDLLMSLPVPTGVVITSRFLTMYLMNLLITLAVMVSMGAGYVTWANPPAYFYPVWAVGMLLAPLIPTTIATVIGALIIWISSRFRYAGVIATVISFGLLLAVLAGSLLLGNLGEGQVNLIQVQDIGQMILDQMHKMYPPAALFHRAVEGDGLSFLLFALLAVAWYGIFVLLAARKYKSMNTGLMTYHSKSHYRLERVKTASPVMAIVKKEWKRFYSCHIYILNMGMGIVMALAVSAGCAFLGAEKIETTLNMPGFAGVFERIMPFIPTVMLCLTATTAVSLSLEGKNLWILKSLPLKKDAVYKGKVLFNLFLTVPTALVCSVLLCFCALPGLPMLLLLFVTPLVYACFTSVFGMWVNLKFPNYSWTSETAVVKQSAASFISIFLGMINGAAPILVLILKPGWDAALVTLMFTIAEGAATGLLWMQVRRMNY